MLQNDFFLSWYKNSWSLSLFEKFMVGPFVFSHLQTSLCWCEDSVRQCKELHMEVFQVPSVRWRSWQELRILQNNRRLIDYQIHLIVIARQPKFQWLWAIVYTHWKNRTILLRWEMERPINGTIYPYTLRRLALPGSNREGLIYVLQLTFPG